MFLKDEGSNTPLPLQYLARHNMAPPTDPPQQPQKVSLSLGRLKKAPPPAPTNGVKRPRDALREDEDGGEDLEEQQRATKVSHFDLKAGGALDESDREVKNAPLVIARQANRDWKDAANRKKRGRGGVPGREERGEGGREERNGGGGGAGAGTTEPSKIFGVSLASSRGEDANDALKVAEQTQGNPPEPNAEVSVAPKTEDEEAMDALLGRTKKSELMIPALTEEDAFQNDVTEAPDMATLEDYARVPVEQFGAAMLRGMGWKDGDGIGLNKGTKQVKAKIPERRPALLGIGAKEEAAVAQEMGTWGKAARGKGGKEPVVYNPILLRDKKTGEMFTEEEAKKREEQDERERYEMEFERKEQERDRERGKDKDKDKGRESRRRRDDEDDERERRREKDRRRDRGDDRHRDHDRERRRRDDDGEEDEEERRRRKDKDKGRESRRRREDEDDERERRREKDRRRDRGDDRHRDHDRERRRLDDDGEEDEEERRRRKDKERRRREREDEDYDRERSKRHDRDRDGHRRRERSREHRRR